LNLDKRDLTHMPLLEGEERLRLLNLQHNHVQKIENLVSLPALIFLDLYNNNIKEISHLHTVPTLRVLMLGKNYIERIRNL
jgi:leucine-rich repeat-containing protein 49